MRDRGNVLKDETIRPGFRHKPRKVFDERASAIASRDGRGGRTRQIRLAVRTRPPVRRFVTGLSPIGRFRKRLAWRSANYHERVGERKTRLSPKLLTSALGNVCLKELGIG